MQYVIVFSASKAQKPDEAGGVWKGLRVGQRIGQIWSKLLKNGFRIIFDSVDHPVWQSLWCSLLSDKYCPDMVCLHMK